MDVYLVPVDVERYELYCEVPEDPDEEGIEAEKGYFRRQVHRFREMLADAERERRQGTPVTGDGWLTRRRKRFMRWVVETIAEQRLLWHLRQQDSACLHYPDDIDEHTATTLLRQHLAADSEKHRRWMIIDGIAFLVSVIVLGPLFLLVPGVANLPAAYFGFRVVGHYLSLRGAARGLKTVAWRYETSAPLTELRRVLTLEPGARQSRVQAIAETLRLEHFESFFQRTAVSA
jgi:Mitochondrial K+-H+ exchange-related